MKRMLVIILLLFVSCAMIQKKRDYTDREKRMYLGMLAAHSLDCGTTHYILHHGGIEVNPIFDELTPEEAMRNIIATHLILVGIKTVVMHYFPSTRSALMWWSIGPHTFAGTHNAIRIYRYNQED